MPNTNSRKDRDNSDTKKIAYGIDRYAYQQGENAQFNFSILENLEPSIVARGGAAVAVPRNGNYIKRK